MSATEVIEEIKRLPPKEQERVREFLSKTPAQTVTEQAQANFAPDAVVEKVAEKVFNEHDSLFRRLAQ
jgi:hypothetical protein